MIVIDELRRLLEFAHKAGYIDICKKYSKVQTHQKIVQKDPNQGLRWGLTAALEKQLPYFLLKVELVISDN